MNITRLLLLTDWRTRVRTALPRITDAQLDAMGALIVADRFTTDDRHAHPDLTALLAGKPQQEKEAQ